MMSSTKDEFCLERQIEIWENQRLWIGKGFSSKGLFPTERGPYSTKDGSLRWKTLDEASSALLSGDFTVNSVGGSSPLSSPTRSARKLITSMVSSSNKIVRRGWSFNEGDGNNQTANQSSSDNIDECSSIGAREYCTGFTVCNAPEDRCDENGWQYYLDFLEQSLLSSNRKRGILDFVRRRRLCRTAFFRPNHFLPTEIYTKCDYCDSTVVNMLSNAMLDALSLATLYANGNNTKNNEVTDALVLPLKSKLVDILDIGNNSDNVDQSEEYDPMADINKVKDRLTSFAEDSVGQPGMLQHLLNPDVDYNIYAAMPRRKELIGTYFTQKERPNLARLLVKDVDRYSYKLHCSTDSCSCNDDNEENACVFRLVPCPYEGCEDRFSWKYREQHDIDCQYKPVPCPNDCGMDIPRRDVHIHVRDRCRLRAAACPLSSFGCTSVVQAQDVTSHLNENADKHFMLIANRMAEYQTVMKDQSNRIRMLEEKNEKLERELKQKTVQLQSKNEAKAVANDVKKLSKRLASLEGTCKTQFKKIEVDRRNHKK